MYINLRAVKCITFNQFGYMSDKEIRNALSNNKIVHWYNNLYKVVKSIYNNNLYVVCVQNEFTTLLECCDLKDCYIKEN